MKVFVTGASGFIGSFVLPELIAAGHQVTGMARSDASAQAVEAAGAAVVRGDLDDLDALRRGAEDHDAVVHLAFVHDFTDFGGAIAKDRAAIEAFGSALAGSGKAFTIASGTPVVPGKVATEEDDPVVPGPMGGRGENARLVLGLAGQNVRSSIVRLPRTVHGSGGRGGFAGALIQIARRSGVSGYVGDGAARWPAVAVEDAARLFRIAVDDVPAGTVLHAVKDEGVSLLDTAAAIGRGLDVPVKAVAPEELGFLGQLAGIDQPASSRLTQERFSWTPTGAGLLENLDQGHFVTD